MNRGIITTLMLLATLLGSEAMAQKYPERRFIRKGTDAFQRGNYVESEVDYRRALERKPDSYEAAFDLAGALYKQERYADAQNIYNQLAQDSIRTQHAPMSNYNNGNALFQQKKYQEAIEAYKSSLRKAPDDQQTKFNLAYAQKKLEDQKKEEDKKDKNKDKDKDKKEQDKKEQPQEQNKEEQKPQEQPQQQQSGMNKEQADQVLQAMQNNEDRTREKVNAQKPKTTAPSGKNW